MGSCQLLSKLSITSPRCPPYLQGLPPSAQLLLYVLLSHVTGALLRLQPLFQGVLVRAEGQRYLAEGGLGELQKAEDAVRVRLSTVIGKGLCYHNM